MYLLSGKVRYFPHFLLLSGIYETRNKIEKHTTALYNTIDIRHTNIEVFTKKWL